MSLLEKHQCDGCGKETSDYYVEVGWIHFDNSPEFTISKGRIKGGEAKTKFHRGEADHMDFCSVECMAKFLKAMK